jgi:hypothetical protein
MTHIQLHEQGVVRRSSYDLVRKCQCTSGAWSLFRRGYHELARPTKAHGEVILMIELLKDLWGFMRERKKFWLAPIIVVMLLLGVLIVLAQGSAVAPFIYTLF